MYVYLVFIIVHYNVCIHYKYFVPKYFHHSPSPKACSQNIQCTSDTYTWMDSLFLVRNSYIRNCETTPSIVLLTFRMKQSSQQVVWWQYVTLYKLITRMSMRFWIYHSLLIHNSSPLITFLLWRCWSFS